MHDNETNKWLRIHQLGVNRKRTRTVLDKTWNGFLLYCFVSHEVIDIPFIITGLAIHFISNLWDLRYCLYVWIQTCQEIHISRFIFGHHGPFFHSSDKRKAILKIRSLTVQNKKFTLFLSKTRILFVGNSSTCIFTLIHSILKRISGVYQAQILSNEKPLFIVLILNFLIRTSSILPTFKAVVQSSYFERRKKKKKNLFLLLI